MLEVLKELYGENVTEESLCRFKEELGKKFVPKSEFNQRGEELKQLREKLESAAADTEQVASLTEEKNNLLSEISLLKEQYEKDIQAAQHREDSMRLDYGIERALTLEKARNIKAVKALLNMDEISLKEGQVVGLGEQLAKLKEDNNFLFEAEENVVQFIRPAAGTLKTTKEDFQNMSYMERLKLKKEQPDLYKTLIETNRR